MNIFGKILQDNSKLIDFLILRYDIKVVYIWAFNILFGSNRGIFGESVRYRHVWRHLEIIENVAFKKVFC